MQKDNAIFLNTEEQNEDNEEKSQFSVKSSQSEQDEDRHYSYHNYDVDNQQVQKYISNKKQELSEKKSLINEKKQNEEADKIRQKNISNSQPQKVIQLTNNNGEVQGSKKWVSKNINQINLAEIGQVYESKQAYADWMNQIENSVK